ncbi:hypothetical protein ACFQ0O_27915 [Saccharopolyspora spinosporotrichia]|nr:hypothetical protein [Saccharopolyspora erythraea]
MTDELDEVLLHLGDRLSDEATNDISAHLDEGRELYAAETMASTAVANHLTLSATDRARLRQVIEAHGGNRKHIDMLDSRDIGADATVRMGTLRFRGHLTAAWSPRTGYVR